MEDPEESTLVSQRGTAVPPKPQGGKHELENLLYGQHTTHGKQNDLDLLASHAADAAKYIPSAALQATHARPLYLPITRPKLPSPSFRTGHMSIWPGQPHSVQTLTRTPLG